MCLLIKILLHSDTQTWERKWAHSFYLEVYGLSLPFWRIFDPFESDVL